MQQQSILYPEFADLLRQSCQSASLHDSGNIGALLADAQTSPAREGIPYPPCVVNAWLKGSALPEPLVFQTLLEILVDQPQAQRLEECYDSLSFDPKTRYVPEAMLALRHRMREAGILQQDFTGMLHAAGYTKVSGSGLNQWLAGKYMMPAEAIKAADRALGIADTADSLMLLHTQRPTERILPQDYLNFATQGSFASRLKNIRKAMGLTLSGLSKEIGSITGKSPPPSAILNWEQADPNKKATIPSRESFPNSDAITVYGEILGKHGFGEWFLTQEPNLRLCLEVTLENQFKRARIPSIKSEQPIFFPPPSHQTRTNSQPHSDGIPARGPYTHSGRAK